MISSYKIYSAPLQGFTTHVWRNAHARIFGGIDCYLSPFIRIEHGSMLKRDLNDVNPDNNSGIPFIPQILACKPDDATMMVCHLRELGYKHINVNLGCPFPPIALRHKGSGMLPYPAEVESLFNALAQISDITYSVKMRLGWDADGQWKEVLHLMSIISPAHITVHPCIGRDQYKGNLNLDELDHFMACCEFPVIYNGEITSQADIQSITQRWPSLHGIMIGRALASNPALLCPEKATTQNYSAMHDEIYRHFTDTLDGGEHQVLKKMQSFWELYLLHADRKSRKAIKKATSIAKYEAAVDSLFAAL